MESAGRTGRSRPAEEIGKLHLSKVGDRTVLNGEFDPLHGEIIATALREADTQDRDRTVLSVRVRRWRRSAGSSWTSSGEGGAAAPAAFECDRDLKDLLSGGPGSTVEGAPIPGPILAAWRCDTNLHRCDLQRQNRQVEYG